jgi:hypothetical protein
MKVAKLLVLCLMVTALTTSYAHAQLLKLPFGKAKNTQQNSVYLSQKDGPWLIMCASFVGEEGRQQAIRLAGDLRQNHRLKAFVYSHEFNFTEKVAGLGMGWEPYMAGNKPGARPIRMKAAGESSFEEFAVLVGDFSSVEDSKAQKTLDRIKKLQPESMANYDPSEALSDDSLAGARLRAWRDFSVQKSDDPEKRMYGPMKAAFLLPNPLLPEEYFAARKIDDFVLGLNRGLKYSVMKNPAKYTVKIATFSGEMFEESQMEEQKARDSWLAKNRKGLTDSKLVNAAKRATVLTAYLRSKNIEAYEFHDRHESYVCVGGFDWMVETDSSGRKENNPEMVELIKKFKGSTIRLPGKGGGVQTGMKTYPLPTRLSKAGIACDIQPIPVLVRKGDGKRVSSKFFGMKR